jgi:hypothetical protein
VYNKNTLLYIVAIFGAIIILLLFQVSLITKGFYSISADESFHTFQAYLWSKHHFKGDFVWLPFYKIFVGSFLYLFQNLLIVPRIISICFGILTLLGVTYLSYQLFKNQIVSVITAFLSSLFFPLVILSVLPLTEIMFIFFITMAFSFFVKWLNEKKKSLLILACSFFFISDSIRYEGWIYSLSFFLILLFIFYRDKALKNNSIPILISAFILSGFPILWIALEYIQTGKFLGFVTNVAGAYRPMNLIDNLKYNPLYQFIKINLNSLSIIGIVPLIILSRRDNRIRNFAYVFSIALIVMALSGFFVKTMPSHNYWRIACSWSILLLPFTSYMLNLFLKTKFRIKYLNAFSFIVVISIITLFFIRQDQKYSSLSYFTNFDLRTGRYINQVINKKNESSGSADKILIVSNDSHYINVEIASQQPILFKNVVKPTLKNDYIYVGRDIQFNNSLLKKYSIKYLIMPTLFLEGYEVKNVTLKKLNTFGYWTVHKIISYSINTPRDTSRNR